VSRRGELPSLRTGQRRWCPRHQFPAVSSTRNSRAVWIANRRVLRPPCGLPFVQPALRGGGAAATLPSQGRQL